MEITSNRISSSTKISSSPAAASGQIKKRDTPVKAEPFNSWHLYGKKTDVNNCSLDQLMETASSLYLEGEISQKSMLKIGFDKHASDNFLDNHGFNVQNNPYRTPADKYGNRDWVKEFEIKYKEALNRKDDKNASEIKEVLIVLEKLSEARNKSHEFTA